MAQIHELNEYQGTPGNSDFLAIDNGTDTSRISAADLVEPFLPQGGLVWYGTCSTLGRVTEKVVICSGFTLDTGATIAVKFSDANTASAPTLNVNGTGAVAIKAASGGTESLVGLWRAGEVVVFTYDGTNWLVDSSSRAGVIVVSATGVSSLSTTITDANITSKHVVVASTLSNPAAQTDDWTVTTSNGSLSIAGSISGTTDITLVLAYQTN